MEKWFWRAVGFFGVTWLCWFTGLTELQMPPSFAKGLFQGLAMGLGFTAAALAVREKDRTGI